MFWLLRGVFLHVMTNIPPGDSTLDFNRREMTCCGLSSDDIYL